MATVYVKFDIKEEIFTWDGYGTPPVADMTTQNFLGKSWGVGVAWHSYGNGVEDRIEGAIVTAPGKPLTNGVFWSFSLITPDTVQGYNYYAIYDGMSDERPSDYGSEPVIFRSILKDHTYPYSSYHEWTFVDYRWVEITIPSQLFTDQSDAVNFNSLTSEQQDAVDDSAALYAALDGSDVVALPNAAALSGTSISWDASRAFSAGGGNDRIVGGALADLIRGNSDNDLLHGNGANDKLWGEGGRDRLWGGMGHDSLSGGFHDDLLSGDRGFDFLGGGDGDDTLYGGIGKDRLNGGEENDRLFGGADEDTFVFTSTDFVNSWGRFNQARNLQFNLDGTNVTNRDGDRRVVLSSLSEGLDFNQDGEIAQFQNGKQDLSAMKIVIRRTDDGHAKGEVWDNGVLDKKLTALISGDAGPSTKPLKDMLWDTLTPIAAKSYSGHYRNDGKLGERIELSGWENGEGRIVEDGVTRSNVQIHGGRHNGNSEGCFLVNGTFKNALFDHLKNAVRGNGDFSFDEWGRFYPVVPVVIEVLKEVPQTKIVGIDAEVPRPLAGKESVTASVGFDVREFGLEHFRKSIDVFFTAEGRGWTFAKALVKADPEGGTAHGHIWREARNASGEMVYGIRIGLDAEGNLRSHVKFDVLVKAGDPREINFHIVDLDLWSNRGNINQTNWQLYDVSTDANDTDKPNGAEALLLTPLGSDGRDATIDVINAGSVFANGAGEVSAVEEFWL